MAKFVKDEVVVVPFPFSDLTQAKRRPAMVLANAEGDDLILCQITSQAIKDRYAIPIRNDDFESGSLKQVSQARPNRLFTADNHIVLYSIGRVHHEKVSEVIERVIEIIRS